MTRRLWLRSWSFRIPLIGVCLLVVVVYAVRAAGRSRAIRALETCGAEVFFGDPWTMIPKWMRSVQGVRLRGRACQLTSICAFPEIEELGVVGADIKSVDLRCLRCVTKLRKVEIRGTRVSSEGVRLMCSNKGIRVLNLSDTNIGDQDLAALSELSLSSLELANTAVTDAGIRELVGMPLEVLDLSGTDVSDAGLEEVSEITTLRLLYVSDAHIKRARAESVAKKLGLELVVSQGGVISLPGGIGFHYIVLDTGMSDVVP